MLKFETIQELETNIDILKTKIVRRLEYEKNINVITKYLTFTNKCFELYIV